MLEFLKDAFILVWFISLVGFIYYWRKKVSAKKSAGENYKDDETYQQISKTKRLIGIVCLVSFVIGGAIPLSPETKAERAAQEQQKKIEQVAKNEQKAADKAAKEAEKQAKEAEKQAKAQKEAEEKAAAEANKYAEADIDILISEAKSNAAKANKNYKGKYVKIVGGVLDHIESDGDYISISNGDMTLLHVVCYPRNKEVKNQMLELSNGQTVTVYGKITDVGGIMGYRLDLDRVE